MPRQNACFCSFDQQCQRNFARSNKKNRRYTASGIEIKAGTEAHKQHHSVFHYVHKTNTFDQRAFDRDGAGRAGRDGHRL